MSTEKEPFEKIRSLVERRKLFQSLAENSGEVVCKADGDALFIYVPVAPDNHKLLFGTTVMSFGTLKTAQVLTKNQEILGHFTVEPDRYFLRGLIRPAEKGEGHVYELDAESEVFKLQRRKTFRVQLPASFPIYFRVRTHEGKSFDLDLKIADLSVGGMRIYSPEFELPFKENSVLVGTLYPPSSRGIDITATVKHIQSSIIDHRLLPQYGVEFLNPTQTLKNRMTSLTLDFQHKIVTRYGTL
jgi:hypothetical protein